MFEVFDDEEPVGAIPPPSSRCAPGPGLAAALAVEARTEPSLDPTQPGCGPESIPFRTAQFTSVQHVGSWERLAGWVVAQQWWEIHAAVARTCAAPRAAGGCVDELDVAMRSLVSDVALAWRVHDRTAQRRVDQAVNLVEGIPLAVEALADGRISVAHVHALADVLLDVDDPEVRRRLCEELLPEPDDDADSPAPKATRKLRTPAGLKRAARHAAARHDPGASSRRAARARRERGVFLDEAGDGMACLTVYLPAEEALTLYRVITAHARRTTDADSPAGQADPGMEATTGDGNESRSRDAGERSEDGEPHRGEASSRRTGRRSADNRRADALVDLVTGGALLAAGVVPDAATPQPATPQPATPQPDSGQPDSGQPDTTPPGSSQPSRHGPSRATRRKPWPSVTNVQIRVVIGIDTLLGLDELPAELVGYGPINADHARALAVRNDATWRRMVIDPLSNTVLDVGHQRYRPPAAMRDHIRAQHPTCAFPGCRMPAEACDIDHVVPYDPDDPTGVTSVGNTRPGCRSHHLLKTLGGWLATTDDHDTVWTSPTGHRYRTVDSPLLTAGPCPCTTEEITEDARRDRATQPAGAAR